LWDKYRAEFPITENYTYLNHAAVGPLSTRVRERLDLAAELFMSKGCLCFEEVMDHAGRVRENASRMIECLPEEISFVKNTTSGVLLAAGSLKWDRGDNLVMPGFEFPANVYPWMSLRKKGVQVRMVRPEKGRVTAEALIGECDSRTRVVTVSLVQFSNGYRLDLRRLGNFCRDRGILLHVDAIQGMGAVNIKVKEANIDLLSAGGHKWLLSLGGAGLFYCRKPLIEEMEIPNPGWTGVEEFMDFLDYRFSYRPDGSRFEEGTLNAAGIMAMGASLERFLEIGMDRVEERILELTGYLADGLIARGCTITSPFGEGERSGIVSFTHPEKNTEVIYQDLIENNIIVSLREGAVRVSPHFYNNRNDIERIFMILDG